jgi:hypothetical protein
MKKIQLFLSAFVLLGMPAHLTQAQSTNAPQFLRMTKTPDSAVVMQWLSDPLTMYRVEYSTTLTNGSWLVAQENFPPQGTNTFWTDRGNDSSFGPRLSSAEPDAPYRFYRLAVDRYMSNNAPVGVSIGNYTNGATISGLVSVTGTASATQGIASVKLYVDGDQIGIDSGPAFTLALESRHYPNGPHRISAVAMDAGAYESTEAEVPAGALLPSYGSTNISVVFDNDLSNVRLSHKAFRPDLGQTQHISATWSTPRMWRVDISVSDSASNVFRSFSGDGTALSVLWDGTDSGGGQINPQIVAYHFHDLGEGTAFVPSGGGGSGGPPSPGMAAMAAGKTSYFAEPPPMPPVKQGGKWYEYEELFGPLPMIEVTIPKKAQERFLQGIASKQVAVISYGATPNSPAAAEATGPSFTIYGPVKVLGTMGVLSQGHHPRFGSYPTPSRGPGLGNVRMSSTIQFGPWGPLAAPTIVATDCLIGFPPIGYKVLVKQSDDFCSAADLRRTSSGGSNTLNQVNLGLFVGHSVAARDSELSIGYRQSYVPIYKKSAGTMTFVKSTEMRFGSSNLKWMAFYSCNLFRDALYRPDDVYNQMKNNSALPMSSQLHVLQGYATEMSVHPDMIYWWTRALSKNTLLPTEHTVLGAWKFVCLKTQPPETDQAKANVSRSVYWPECAGDYIYGWGPQTDPNGGGQGNLQEDDQMR